MKKLMMLTFVMALGAASLAAAEFHDFDLLPVAEPKHTDFWAKLTEGEKSGILKWGALTEAQRTEIAEKDIVGRKGVRMT